MIKKVVPQNSTFIVRVENRQNGTWQGKIIWADDDHTEHFSSVLEMLKIMEKDMATDSNCLLKNGTEC